MDVTKTINKLKTRYKLNQEQVNELMNYYEKLNKDFESGFYDSDLKTSLFNSNSSQLYRSILSYANDYFLNSTIPYACVFIFVSYFVDEKYNKAFCDKYLREGDVI